MKDLGDYTRLSPEKRYESLMKYIDVITKNEKAHSVLTDWGIRMDRNIVAPLQGRVLNPETLYFGNNYHEVVNAKGDWGRTATSKPMLTAIQLNKWAVLFDSKNGDIARKFSKLMMEQGIHTEYNSLQYGLIIDI